PRVQSCTRTDHEPRGKGAPMCRTYTWEEDADNKHKAGDLEPTDAEIAEEVDKFIAGKPSKIKVKTFESVPEGDPFEIPPGYETAEAPDRIRKPMSPELQQILDDAKAAGFEVSGDLDNAIFIAKHRAGGVPTGLQIMPDHAALRAYEAAN